jgi:hypothetical protein
MHWLQQVRHNDILGYSFFGFCTACKIMVIRLDTSEGLCCMLVNLCVCFVGSSLANNHGVFESGFGYVVR